MSTLRRQSGIALITVLWLLLLLSVIAAGTLREARTEANLTRNGLEAAKARAVAEAGIHRALLALSGNEVENGWRTDGTAKAWSFAGNRVRITIQDEAGRIDLNRADVALLEGLFLAAELDRDQATALANAIADFRDSNDLRRLNGSEDRDYAAAGLPWGAKDAHFDRVDELARVLGFTKDLLDRIRPAVTVHSGQTGVDLSSAPRLVLLALPGINASEVETYLQQRSDLGPTAVNLASALEQFTSRGRAGRTFEIRSEARSAGAIFVRKAIVRRTEGSGLGFRIEAWGQV